MQKGSEERRGKRRGKCAMESRVKGCLGWELGGVRGAEGEVAVRSEKVRRRRKKRIGRIAPRLGQDVNF